MIEAAGAVLWNEDAHILLVHRAHYDDWSLPKGKLDPGETHAQAAARELFEETGLHATIGDLIGDVHYATADGHAKRVRYYHFQYDSGAFVVNPEVDRIRWVPRSEAIEIVTYDADRAFLTTLEGP